MTKFNRFTTIILNPVAIALCTSSLGLAASTLAHAPLNEPAPAGVLVSHQRGVYMVEGPVQVHGVQPLISDGEIVIEEPDAATELAERFNLALSQPPAKKGKPAGHSRSKTAASDAPKLWVCGEWEQLWQGRGQGRTCEWK